MNPYLYSETTLFEFVFSFVFCILLLFLFLDILIYRNAAFSLKNSL